MTKLIKKRIHTIINAISSVKDVSQRSESSDKIVKRSKHPGSDEHGYFSNLENL